MVSNRDWRRPASWDSHSHSEMIYGTVAGAAGRWLAFTNRERIHLSLTGVGSFDPERKQCIQFINITLQKV